MLAKRSLAPPAAPSCHSMLETKVLDDMPVTTLGAQVWRLLLPPSPLAPGTCMVIGARHAVADTMHALNPSS